jgi:hypothetical protein
VPQGTQHAAVSYPNMDEADSTAQYFVDALSATVDHRMDELQGIRKEAAVR